MRLVVLFCYLLPVMSYAQAGRCTNTFIEKKCEDAARIYLDEDYEPESTVYFRADESPGTQFKKEMDSDFEYIILLITPKGTTSGAISIFDNRQSNKATEKKSLYLDSDYVTLEFTPHYDGVYNLIGTIRTKGGADNCSALVVLKREPDPEPSRRK